MAGTIGITAQSFEQHVDKQGIVFIDWWASWCGPCRAFAPVYEAAAARHPDLVWGKVDTEAEPSLAAAFDIRSIPTLMIFRDGVLVFAQPGMVPAAALDQLVAAVRGLDMEKLKREVAEEEARAAAQPPPAA